jgi:hypothetical protein
MASDKTIITPLGTFFYTAFMEKPDKYDNISITLGFTDAALKEFKEMYDEEFSEYYTTAELKKKNLVKSYPKEKKDEATGLTLVSFSQKAQRTSKDGKVLNFTIEMFDWKNKRIEGVKIATGTTGRVLLTIYAPDPFEGKARLRLQPKAVKIKNLIPYTGGSAGDAFGEEEDDDGYVHTPTSLPEGEVTSTKSNKEPINSDIDDSLL